MVGQGNKTVKELERFARRAYARPHAELAMILRAMRQHRKYSTRGTHLFLEK